MHPKRSSVLLATAVLVLAGSSLASNPYTEDPGFKAKDFQERCQRLVSAAPDGIIIVGNAGTANAAWLTGAQGREARLILVPEPVRRKAAQAGMESTLFLPPASPRWGVWDDPELSPGEAAVLRTGVPRTAELKDFYVTLAAWAPFVSRVYVCRRGRSGQSADLGQDVLETVARVLPSAGFENLMPLLDDVRWSKSSREIEVMRKACRLTSDAFLAATRSARPGMYEYEVEAVISYVFRKNGAAGPDFLIVGSGPNSCVLHHMGNDRLMGEGELLLLDFGVDYHGMATDLTRTVPLSGKFSAEQKKVYAIVLEAQKKAISVVRPGATLGDVHRAAFEVIDKAGFGKYFIHGSGHSLNGGSGFRAGEPPSSAGLRTDQERLALYAGQDNVLRPGCIFTIEPGIYIPGKNIGVRIEDDVLVTESGCEVLTRDAPKEIAEIEKLMADRPKAADVR